MGPTDGWSSGPPPLQASSLMWAFAGRSSLVAASCSSPASFVLRPVQPVGGGRLGLGVTVFVLYVFIRLLELPAHGSLDSCP